MKKPTKKTGPSYYDFQDVMDWLIYTFCLDTRDGMAFWRWVLLSYEVDNGSQFALGLGDVAFDDCPAQMKSILRLLKQEFAPEESTLEILVEW